MLKKDDRLATFKIEGQIGDRQTLSGRIVLNDTTWPTATRRYATIDEKIIQHFRRAAEVDSARGVGSRPSASIRRQSEHLFGGTYSDVNGIVEIRNLFQSARGAGRCARRR